MALSVSVASIFAAPAELRVKGDRVNLRARPVFDSEVAGQVSTGDILIAPDGIPEGAEWVMVRPPASVDVWIFSALLTGDEVNASDCLVRCGPGLNYKFVGKLDKGDKIVKRGAPRGDWQPIAPIAAKCELFISSDYVEAIQRKQPQASPLQAANEPARSDVNPPPPTDTAPVSKQEEQQSPLPTPSIESAARQPEQIAEKSTPPPPAPPVEKHSERIADKPAVAIAASPVAPSPVPVASALNPKPTGQPAPAPVVAVPNQAGNPPAPTTASVPPTTPTRPIFPAPLPRRESQPKVPSALLNLSLDELQPQGTPVVYSGRLEKIPSMRTTGIARYQLVAKTGVMKSAIICRLSGLTGQWRELLNSNLEVTGRLWYLSGDPVPILHASRVIREESWED